MEKRVGHESVVPDEDPQEESSALEEWKRVAAISGGLSVGGAIVAGGAWVGREFGRWLDPKLGLSNDVFATIFPILGFIAGITTLWRMVKRIQK